MKKILLAVAGSVALLSLGANAGDLNSVKKDSFASNLKGKSFAMGVAVEGNDCPVDGDMAMSADGLILSCQSGDWGKQSKKSTESYVNLGAEDFNVNCKSDLEVPGDKSYSCRGYVTTVNVPAGQIKTLVASVTQITQGGSLTGHDSFISITLDGHVCGANRFPILSGHTPWASASCIKTLGEGEHVLKLGLRSSTGLVNHKWLLLTGGISLTE